MKIKYWISKRQNFLPIDNSPFTNEIFTPEYSKYFYSLSPDKKQALLYDQKLASDGISEHTLQDIYQKLYLIKYVKELHHDTFLLPSHRLNEIKNNNNKYHLF